MEKNIDSDAVAEKNRVRMKAALLAEHRQNRSLPAEFGKQCSVDSGSTPSPPGETVRSTSTSGSFSGPTSSSTSSTPSTLLSNAQLSLVRKHSCGDLVSRLKSRKLLGVGESSGEIHRSKISQLLGHSEHLFTRYPNGFWHWYRLLLVQYSLTGLWKFLLSLLMFLIISPGEETSKEASTSEDHHHFDQQLSGVLYLGLATLLWNFYQSHDKLLVRFLVNVVSLICVLRVVLLVVHFYANHLTQWMCCLRQEVLPSEETEVSSVPFPVKFYLLTDLVTVSINLYYQYRMSQPNTYSGGGLHHHHHSANNYQRQLSGGSNADEAANNNNNTTNNTMNINNNNADSMLERLCTKLRAFFTAEATTTTTTTGTATSN